MQRLTLQKYVVQRKLPIGRHERILAIDGDYIHVSASRGRWLTPSDYAFGVANIFRLAQDDFVPYHVGAVLQAYGAGWGVQDQCRSSWDGEAV